MPLPGLPPQEDFRDIGAPEHLAASALDCMTQEAEHPFGRGYLAGWQSVRGADDEPLLIPPSPVLVGPAMYMVGYSRGARDAGGMAPRR